MGWISRYWSAASLTVIVVATIGVYWPGLRGFLVLDDYFLIAISRLVGNPLSAFIHNHFPGGFFYRPLTMTFWWICTEIVGDRPRVHYLLNLSLHLGISLALWRLLRAWAMPRSAALLSTLVFAVHPIAIGTALWLSDRFDLLATLLTVCAVDAALRYRMQPTARRFVATCLCASLGALSKETGFAAFAPILVIWCWPPGGTGVTISARFWTAQRRAAIPIALLALTLLGWRGYVLGSGLQPTFLNGASPLQIIVEGVTRWTSSFFIYVFQLSRLNSVGRFAIVACVAGACATRLFGLVRQRRLLWRGEAALAITSGLALMFATAVLQAPTLRLTPIDLTAQTNAVVIACNSRFFYLSLIGLSILLAALRAPTAPLASPNDRVYRSIDGIALFLASIAALVWAWTAHRLAHDYARESWVQGRLMLAASAQIAHMRLPAEHCQVYFVGVPQDQAASFTSSVDAAIKALSPDLERVQNCLFQTEATPWFHFFKRGGVTPDSVAPMQPLMFAGSVLPWLEYGEIGAGYLNLVGGIDPQSMRSAVFLGYDNGSFVDVTADVLEGRRTVTFRCIRGPEQCVSAPAHNAPSPSAAH